jgi:hypothetical protein
VGLGADWLPTERLKLNASLIYAETKGGWHQGSGGTWFGTIYASGASRLTVMKIVKKK